MQKILLIEDDQRLSELIKEFLQQNSFIVDIVNRGDRAQRQILNETPDLIILDIMLPGVHGVDILRQLKQLNPNIKAIMVTAVDDEAIAREAMAEGAVDYVTKPLDLNYLDTLVTFQLG